LEYDYIDTFDVIADDNESVDFAPVSGYTLEVSITNVGGTGAVFSVTSTSTAKVLTPKYFDGAVSEWTDPTKWITYINIYQAWKGVIEYLKLHFPSADIYMLIFPWFVMNPNDYKDSKGNYDQLAYNNAKKAVAGRVAMNIEIAKFYNLPIIDAHSASGITCANYSQYYNVNDVHPKDVGYEIFGKYIARQLLCLTNR
jgi:hypothetical protein